LSSFIQVDKNEWEAFLEDLSELERKYKLLLKILDMDESRLQTLTTPEKKTEGSSAAPRHVPKSPEKGVGEKVKDGFLSRLKAKLEPTTPSSMGRSARLGMLGRPQGYAACSRCGSPIVRATKFCQRCGADFGKMMCSCGRELGSGDRFCDLCGRGVGS
jgi:hypothetical protein